MAMSRKHFVEMARIISESPVNGRRRLAQEFASMAARENSAFNRAKFMDACGVDENRAPLSFDYISAEFRTLDHETTEHAKVKVISIGGDTRWLDFPTAALGDLENLIREVRREHGLDD